jgi:hypothetical protein
MTAAPEMFSLISSMPEQLTRRAGIELAVSA